MRAIRVELLIRLGERDRAQAMARDLAGDGYRDPEFTVLMRDSGIAVQESAAATGPG
jgi:hypothetical protein